MASFLPLPSTTPAHLSISSRATATPDDIRHMKTGVLLFNLGGPERLEDVKPFLYQLFSDPEIIRVKFTPLRKLIAYTIATLRHRKSEGYYSQIGGGSPLRKLTVGQAQALKEEFRRRGK